MRYPILSVTHGKEVVERLRAGEEIDIEQFVEYHGEGDPIDLTSIHSMCNKLNELRSKYPETLRNKDPKGGQFEREGCVLVHASVPGDTEFISDFDFWRWLAVVELYNLVEWRFGVGKTASLDNFGIGKSDENLLYRMWLRAEIGLDESRENKYALALRGDQDFWRSHILRQRYAWSRPFARAFIRFQFSDENPDNPRLNIDQIRALAKRFKRLNANLFFEFLDERASYIAIEKQANALLSSS